MGFIVKNTTFTSISDLLAPHTCRGCGRIGEVFCNRCKKDIILNHQNYCPNCKTISTNGKCQKCKHLPPVFVVADRDSIVGSLIKDYKYHSVRALAKPLAELLNNILPEIHKKVIVVPLPTTDKHVRSRGLDHTYLLAKNLTKFHQNWSVQKVFQRASNSVQVGSDQKTRILQAKTAYSLNPHFKSTDATYLLVDDVWTTGASMCSCIKKLQQAGVNDIIVALLAVSKLLD